MKNLSPDGYLLFSTRLVRMFAYGFLSVVLVLYLAKLGLSEGLIGLMLSLALIGDAAISLWMTTNADRFGRRRILIVGTGLMLFAAVLFALTDNVVLLLFAAIVGVIGRSVTKLAHSWRSSRQRFPRLFLTNDAHQSLLGITSWAPSRPRLEHSAAESFPNPFSRSVYRRSTVIAL